MKQKVFLIVIFFFGLFWRLLFLDRIPTALHPDELAYTINAQSFLLTGTSLDGKWSPWQLNTLTPMLAEWPALITSLGFLVSQNPLVASKLMSVIMGSLLPFIFAWIAWGLFKKQSISNSILIISAINPWILQNSRFGFDPLYSLFFYMLAIAVFINCKSWQKLLSVPLFIFGFFQYQGYKLLLLPIAVVLIAHEWQKRQFKPNKFGKISGVFMLLIVIIFFGYIFKLKFGAESSRISERSLIGPEYLNQVGNNVNFERRLAIQSKATNLISNKPFNLVFERVDLVFEALSPKNIFLSGDPGNSGFSVWSHGFLYIFDFFLICIGAIYLFKKEELKKGWPILTFFLIGLIPLILNTTNRWFIFRASFTYLSLIFVAGLGLHIAWSFKSKLVKIVVSAILLINIVNFSLHYFVRFPIFSAMGNYFHHRQLANYIERAKQYKPVIVYSPEADSLFQSYLFYTNKLKNNVVEAKNNYSMGKYQIENVTFIHACVPANEINIQAQTILVDRYEEICVTNNETNERVSWPENTAHIAAASIIDSGEIFNIYGDSLCNHEEMSQFISAKNTKTIALEKLSNQEYCNNWLTNTGNILK